ncbi:sugar ABC transporter ATP-binding protein [Thermogutta sp.]|uniref:sugar ABC transporter ATP-binding protein n=1 Tax=Thermogutta sp. TaxID=1962930 RepID=UPI00321F6E78
MTSITREPVLECRRIGKRFGGIVALENVDFDLYPGEVHGVVGSNGAGKSTLMKILAGALADYDGEISVAGEPVRISSPQTAFHLGIAMVYQEFSGIGQLSVAENLFLGRQPLNRLGLVNWPLMRQKAREYLGELGLQLDVDRRLDAYPLVVRQMVEIARAAHRGARILIMDEPTSALSPPEVERLFELIKRFKQRGVAVVFISHFLEDVLTISDRITVLREGRRVLTLPREELTKHKLVEAMIGRGVSVGSEREEWADLPPRTLAPPVLIVEKLTLPGIFEDVNLAVAPGEILGLYGFVGAGHQDLVQALGGALAPRSGRIILGGRTLPLGKPQKAVRAGMVLVTADRAAGLFLRGEVYKNVTIAHLRHAVGNWVTFAKELRAVQPVLKQVGCRPADPLLKVEHLSGGNQQKVVFAKWLLGPVRVLLLEEPTRGMDIAAKAEVMQLVEQLAAQGTAVILASTEPELILAHSHRVMVMSRGRVTAEWSGCRVEKGHLLRAA